MFCPSCSLEEHHSNQFCRACGEDLRPVRFAIEKADDVTNSAVSAREEIGSAIAAKIRETQSANELKKIAENVLPEIEKFLESPEEKRLRRMRDGMIIAASGFGAAIAFGVLSVLVDKEMLFPAVFGIVAFLIGLSFIFNGFFFTIPKKSLPDNSDDAQNQRQLDANINDLELAELKQNFASVTEHTTRQLSKVRETPKN